MGKFTFLWVLLLLSFSVLAQERKITGRIIDRENREPIIGATISVKGTNVSTQSSRDGSFSITIPKSPTTLVISYVGMGTQDVPVTDQSNLSVVLESTSASMNEVVVT